MVNCGVFLKANKRQASLW